MENIPQKSITQMLDELKDDSINHEKLFYIRGDGGIEFWYRGHLHNDEGPAIIHKDGRKDYYINGLFYSEKEFQNIYLNKFLVDKGIETPKNKI